VQFISTFYNTLIDSFVTVNPRQNRMPFKLTLKLKTIHECPAHLKQKKIKKKKMYLLCVEPSTTKSHSGMKIII